MKRFHSSYVLRRFTSPKYSDIYIYRGFLK
jgi:hypothetical protein